MPAPKPERVRDGAEATNANSESDVCRRRRVALGLTGVLHLRHPFGEPRVAVRRRNEAGDEAKQCRAGRIVRARIGHVGAGVAPGASVRANPGNWSEASLSASIPAPVTW